MKNLNITLEPTEMTDHQFARWLCKHGAINNVEIHHESDPNHGLPWNDWRNPAGDFIAKAFYDNKKLKRYIFIVAAAN